MKPPPWWAVLVVALVGVALVGPGSTRLDTDQQFTTDVTAPEGAAADGSTTVPVVCQGDELIGGGVADPAEAEAACSSAWSDRRALGWALTGPGLALVGVALVLTGLKVGLVRRSPGDASASRSAPDSQHPRRPAS